MRLPSENPDREVRAHSIDRTEAVALRLLLDRTEPAVLLDRTTRYRVGSIIARAVSSPTRPRTAR